MTEIERANELYQLGLEAFRAGDNQRCIALTNESLEIGRRLGDEKVIGQALTGLCRAALRNRDVAHLERLSAELGELAESTGDDWWRIVIAHMNAEMARMQSDFVRAEALYDESMRISEATGERGMVATECFNKTFVMVSQGRMDAARELLRRHFEIREGLDGGELNPYGLIALANILSGEGQREGAAVVAFTCRRLMAERNVIPDPADEKQLLEVETLCDRALASAVIVELKRKSGGLTCRQVVDEYL